MTPADARQKRGNLHYAIRYSAHVIWANQKTESFKYHWFRALAMFDVTSFPAILSGIGRHFKFCRYVNYTQSYWIPFFYSKMRGIGFVRHAPRRCHVWCGVKFTHFQRRVMVDGATLFLFQTPERQTLNYTNV